jgi:hypothetical protein
VYLAQHPANTVYYAGSALVFRTVFAAIVDKASDTSSLTNAERMKTGVDITLAHVNEVNLHLHNVLYGLIEHLLSQVFGKPTEDAEQIQVLGAPKATSVGLPMFVDIGQPEDKPLGAACERCSSCGTARAARARSCASGTIGPYGRVTRCQARVAAQKVFAAKLEGRSLGERDR